jgi:thiamine transporter ThiT
MNFAYSQLIFTYFLAYFGLGLSTDVTFRLGLVVHCKRLIRTTIGTVLVHTVILPSRLLSHRCHVVCPVMCRSCVVLRSSLSFHGLLILVSVY